MDGIVGVYGLKDKELVNKAFLATGACQHRGKFIGVDELKYNTKERIERVTGGGSFQALDASYPIAEDYWPDWLKQEVEKFAKCRQV